MKSLVYGLLFLFIPLLFENCSAKKVTSGDETLAASNTENTEKNSSKNKGADAQEAKGQANYIEHIVKPGESISIIAKKYNVTVDSIVKLNNIADPNFILAGQQLKIPSAVEPKK